jgi:hypothetical protein
VFSDSGYANLRPASDKAVRGWLHLGGWYLENLNNTETRATLILELELKGSIPMFAIKATNT